MFEVEMVVKVERVEKDGRVEGERLGSRELNLV